VTGARAANSETTEILAKIALGDPQAGERLLPVLYEELRALARQKLAQEQPGQTLQATALVHEAYLRLVGSDKSPAWDSRGHFFAAAAEAMRRILIENARRKRRHKHGGQLRRVDLDEVSLAVNDPPEDVVAVSEALNRLAQTDSQAAEFVKLRYFAGLSVDEAAQALGVSPRTAHRDWAYARAWLYRELTGGSGDGQKD
jgi:RNA polymerase sigma factor (TIGR02999 family)